MSNEVAEIARLRNCSERVARVYCLDVLCRFHSPQPPLRLIAQAVRAQPGGTAGQTAARIARLHPDYELAWTPHEQPDPEETGQRANGAGRRTVEAAERTRSEPLFEW